MEFKFGNMFKSPTNFDMKSSSDVKKTINLGSTKLDEPGIGSKAKFIPSFDLNLKKPDDVPSLIGNDLEHKNVVMDYFEDYKKTNPDELLYELQEKMVKAQIKAKAMPEQERISDRHEETKRMAENTGKAMSYNVPLIIQAGKINEPEFGENSKNF